MTDRPDDVRRQADRAQFWSRFWWANLAICVPYALVSSADIAERAMLIYLAAVSIIALAVSYAAKSKALRAEEASLGGES